MYIDKLDDIVDKYNNTYHSTIKMRSVDVKSNTYFNYGKEISNKDPKFEIGDILRIWKYKNIFAKVEKVIKRKGDNLYVKWKGYNSSLNSWIDKKDIV